MLRKRLVGCVLAIALLAANVPAGLASGSGGKTPPETAGKRDLSDALPEGEISSDGLMQVRDIRTLLDQLYGPDAEYGPEYDFHPGEVDPLLHSDGQKVDPGNRNPKELQGENAAGNSSDNQEAPTPGPKTPAESVSNIFEDVSSGQYFFEAVVWAVTLGITNGTSPTTFSPAKTCTRAQIITFLWRANGSPVFTSANPFPDVNPDSDFGKAAHWAYKRGLVLDDLFRGDTPCTRADAVTYLWKLDGGSATQRSAFVDVPSWESYSQAVAWAVDAGITKGTSDTTFSPNTTCTRGQIVTFLYRDFLYHLSANMRTAEGQSASSTLPGAEFSTDTLVYHEDDTITATLLKN